MKEKQLEEEIYCLNIELRSLSEILLKREAERLVPNYTFPRMEHDHMDRYKLAAQYTSNKDVMDIACGTGYGSYYLGTMGNVNSVIGGDISEDSIRYASHRYAHEKVSFQKQDAENITISNKVDVVISFETIEHVPNYKKLLNSANNILKDGGIFIVSSPISHLDLDEKPINPYHRVEWGFERFQTIISEQFHVEKTYVQLFQNVFRNEKIWSEYINRRSRLSFLQRIQSRVRKLSTGIKDVPELLHDWNDKRNFSVIEEYKQQYNSNDLGSKYKGYQILICNKK